MTLFYIFVYQKTDIKKLWNSRNNLCEIDLESEETKNLQLVLVEAAKSTVYLKNADGVRFLAFLFTLYPDLIEKLHNAMKTIIPGANKAVADGCGEVYLKVGNTYPFL